MHIPNKALCTAAERSHSLWALTMMEYSIAFFSLSLLAICDTVDAFCPIATYTQITPVPFWLMIVSIAIAVLPVCLSPMISSRWPRPIGIMESIASRPVCSGCLTGCRTIILGAGDVNRACFIAVDLASAILRLSKGVYYASQKAFAYGYGNHLLGTAYLHALMNILYIVKHNRTNRIGALKAEGYSESTVFEFQ